jgi:hypothetical protein
LKAIDTSLRNMQRTSGTSRSRLRILAHALPLRRGAVETLNLGAAIGS